jgi:hypothetical protein
MQQVKGMGGVITDVIVSDKTGTAVHVSHTHTRLLSPSAFLPHIAPPPPVLASGTMTRDNIIIDGIVVPPCPPSLTPRAHMVAVIETLVMTLEIVQDATAGELKCSNQEDAALLK